jgi:hypothetical protein
MNASESPRILILPPDTVGRIISTENGAGEWQPDSWLNDDVRQAIEALDDSFLRDLFDTESNSFRYSDTKEHAGQLATALKAFQDTCLTHTMEIIQILARDPTIQVSEELGAKLEVVPGRRALSVFFGELQAISEN